MQVSGAPHLCQEGEGMARRGEGKALPRLSTKLMQAQFGEITHSEVEEVSE
jgi:hypothetical protein